MPRVRVELKRKPSKNITQQTFNRSKKKITPLLKSGADLRYKVTATWSRSDKPTFMPFVEMLNKAVKWGLKVEAPAAPSASVSVWRLLNDGTDVMRVKMTDPFMRKTTPFQFSSGPGMGGLAYVDPSLSYPGIDRGGWDETANEQLKIEYEVAIDAAIRGA